tara:strand:- start:2932 stop:3162 length:231 start_codon:yes stop_codon:yes gene_type:complete
LLAWALLARSPSLGSGALAPCELPDGAPPLACLASLCWSLHAAALGESDRFTARLGRVALVTPITPVLPELVPASR